MNIKPLLEIALQIVLMLAKAYTGTLQKLGNLEAVDDEQPQPKADL